LSTTFKLKKNITMSVLVNFAIFPTDKGSSVSKYVSNVVKMIKGSGVDYKLTSMATIIETETMAQALEIIQKAYAILETDCERVYCVATFDIKKGDKGRMSQKIKSIVNKIGEVSK